VARTDLSLLADLTPLLDEVRTWPAVEERAPGTFYCRSKPFLHFHCNQHRRRADVRTDAGWVEVDLDDSDQPRLRQVLLAEHQSRVSPQVSQ
jgi:hypothetical protein